MKKIKNFFSNIKEYTTPDAVILYLDNNFPQWRTELKNEEEWKDAFEYDIKICSPPQKTDRLKVDKKYYFCNTKNRKR